MPTTKFFPKIIDRSQGDKLSSEDFNEENNNLYEDMALLFNRNMGAHAKNVISTTMIGAIDSASSVVLTNGIPTQPMIDVYSTFVFPTNQPEIVINKTYNDFTMPVSSYVSAINNEDGSVKSYIDIERLEDNFILSSTLESVSELPIENCINTSKYPYLLRVASSTDDVSVNIKIRALTGTIESNSIEISPFPLIGGTSLVNITAFTHNVGYGTLLDPNRDEVVLTSETRDLYKPVRLLTNLTLYDEINITLNSDLINNVTIPETILGLNLLDMRSNVYDNIGYIGFKIDANVGMSLSSVIPVKNTHNGYLEEYTALIYRTENDLLLITDNIDGEYDQDGVGPTVSLDTDVWILIKIETTLNSSCQLTGFDYTVV